MTEQDLRRIAFVTSRFHELQGLRLVALGVGMLLGLLVWRTAVTHGLPSMSMMAGMMMTISIVLPLLDRHYRTTVGRALAAGESRGLFRGPALMIYGTLLADVALNEGLFSTAPDTGPSLAGLALVAIALWILVRDGARRPQYLLGVIGGGLAVWATIAAPVASRGEALAIAYALVALAVICVGLLDHRQLMMAMTRRTDQIGSREMESRSASEKTGP